MAGKRPDWIIEQLWVRIEGVEGRCFLRGNAHTHRGRFGVWSENLARGLAASKHEIVESSEASRWWVEGFLSGCEPSFYDYYGYRPGDHDVHEYDSRRERLHRARERFRREGGFGQIDHKPEVTIPSGLVERFPRVWYGGSETTWLREEDGSWTLGAEDVNNETLRRGKVCSEEPLCDEHETEIVPGLWICRACGQMSVWRVQP